jgi:hypothetical protein
MGFELVIRFIGFFDIVHEHTLQFTIADARARTLVSTVTCSLAVAW